MNIKTTLLTGLVALITACSAPQQVDNFQETFIENKEDDSFHLPCENLFIESEKSPQNFHHAPTECQEYMTSRLRNSIDSIARTIFNSYALEYPFGYKYNLSLLDYFHHLNKQPFTKKDENPNDEEYNINYIFSRTFTNAFILATLPLEHLKSQLFLPTNESPYEYLTTRGFHLPPPNLSDLKPSERCVVFRQIYLHNLSIIELSLDDTITIYEQRIPSLAQNEKYQTEKQSITNLFKRIKFNLNTTSNCSTIDYP